jgi:HD-GYP domain-containing protein (c-di-GMP phosphodiesterase class II)
MAERSAVRLAELFASLSLATDLGLGQPLEHALRSCIIAVRLGRAAGLSEADLQDAYYLALLRFIGCSSVAVPTQAVFGDEIAARGWLTPIFFGDPASVVQGIAEHVGAGEPPERREAMIAATMAAMPSLFSTGAEQCEVAKLLARRMGFGEKLVEALGQVFERWDGQGVPNQIGGDAIQRPVLVMQLARDIEIYHRLHGVEGALAMARARSGGAYNPEVVEAFLAAPGDVLDGIGEGSLWDAALAAEPGEAPHVTDDELDRILEAMADFGDLHSPYLTGHSRGVADLAAAAALRYGLTARDARTLRHAGLVHDIGRVAVSVAVWDKAGALTESDWERVRLHPYYTERILSRSLAPLGRLASMHHERLDGAGYHRGLEAVNLSPSARILAAADTYQALSEPRSYRAALPPNGAAALLRAEARAGRLDDGAVDAVLEAAGHRVRRTRRHWPNGLTGREVEVLQQLAGGASNRQIAERLAVSPATVDHHLRHIYDKLGVSTRAPAVLFALQHDLLGEYAPEK